MVLAGRKVSTLTFLDFLDGWQLWPVQRVLPGLGLSLRVLLLDLVEMPRSHVLHCSTTSKAGTEILGEIVHTYLDAAFSRASEEDEAAFGEVLNLKKMKAIRAFFLLVIVILPES